MRGPVSMEADFICKAWIVEVLKHNGWSSFAYRMQQKFNKSSTSIRWNRCVSPNVTGVIRHEIYIFIHNLDNTEFLKALIFQIFLEEVPCRAIS